MAMTPYSFKRPGCSEICQSPIGKNRIICFFDRPTGLEKEKGLPVMGITGGNFCILLKILRNTPSRLRDNFKADLYRRQTGIFNTANMNNDRVDISSKVRDTTNCLVLSFGLDAMERLKKFKIPNLISINHLGEQGLMGIQSLDVICEVLNLPIAYRGMSRLFLIAEYIIRKYEDMKIPDFKSFLSEFYNCIGNGFADDFFKYVNNTNYRAVFSPMCTFECCKKCKYTECHLIKKDT